MMNIPKHLRTRITLMSTITTDYSLCAQEIARFHEQGFLGPYAAVSPDEMAAIRENIYNEFLPPRGSSPAIVQSRHMDSKVVFDLASHPAIIGRMASLY